MKKSQEIYKTIKYEDETFSHPTVSVFLPGSKAAERFQLLYRHIFEMACFSPVLTEAEEATMLVRRH